MSDIVVPGSTWCRYVVLILAVGCQGCQGGPHDSDLPPANDAAAPLDVGVDAWVRDAGDDIWDAAPPVWDGFVEPIGFPGDDERGGFFGDQLGGWRAARPIFPASVRILGELASW